MPADPPPSDGPVATDPSRADGLEQAAAGEPDDPSADTPDPVRAAVARHPASRRPDVIRLPDGPD